MTTNGNWLPDGLQTTRERVERDRVGGPDGEQVAGRTNATSTNPIHPGNTRTCGFGGGESGLASTAHGEGLSVKARVK